MIVLQTERLKLRWLTADDAAFIVKLFNDPDWIRFIGDRNIKSEDQAWKWIEAKYIASYWRHGFGLWAISRRSDDLSIGVCGLLRREDSLEVEVGYALLPNYRGKGYAREAASASITYARSVLKINSVVAVTTVHNVASQRLLASLNMQRQPVSEVAQEQQLIVLRSVEAPPTSDDLDDEGQIQSIVTQFFDLFDNRAGVVPRLPMLPHLCVAGTVITRISDLGSENSDIRAFMEPRARLLSEGRLCDFSESEIEGTTRISGEIAQRWLNYRKSGFLDDQPCRGMGTKSMHFVRTPDGWRICAILWQDRAEDPSIVQS